MRSKQIKNISISMKSCMLYFYVDRISTKIKITNLEQNSKYKKKENICLQNN